MFLSWSAKAQNASYLVYSSSSIDQFILIEGNKQDTIKPSRIDKTLFEFNGNPKKTHLLLLNNQCELPTMLTFCNQSKKECSEDIEVNFGENISLSNIFEQSEKTFLESLKDFLGVFKRSRNPAQLSCGNSPSFMGGDKPNPEDPKIKLEVSKYAHYYDWQDFNLEFQIFEGYPIQEISIISKKVRNGKRTLLFTSGEGQETAEIFDWKGEIPLTTTILEEMPSTKEGQRRYRISGEKLATNLFEPIELGAEYQWAIYLKNDSSGHSYLHNFQLIAEAEKALIKTLIKSDGKENKLPILLFAFANDKQTPSGYLDQITEERLAIEEALRQIESDGLCQVEIIPDARLDLVVKAFQRFNNRIVLFHFAGHADEYSLILETKYREKDRVSSNGFAGFLARQNTLQFVFLNGCATGIQAQQLAKKGIPQVIATKREVGDHAAKMMAEWFYLALGVGKKVKMAFQESLDLLRSKGLELPVFKRDTERRQENSTIAKPAWDLLSEADTDWSIPIAAANPLYLLPALEKKIFPQTPFPNAKAYGRNLDHVFWGRDYEIRSFYDRLTASFAARICLFYGVSGVGKTSFLQAGIIPRLKKKTNYFVDNQFNSTTTDSNNYLAKLCSKEFPPGLERIFVFLDDITEPTESIINSIENILKSNPKIHLILSFRMTYRDAWHTAFENEQYWTSFYLPPITQRGMQRLFKNLEKQVRFDEKIPAKVQQLLLIDADAPLTPLLQYILHLLWQKAKAKNYNAPYLTWEDYELWKNNQKEGWKTFLLQQLTKVDQTALDSGLLFQILKEVTLSFATSSKGIAINDLAKNYKTLGGDFFRYLEALKKHRLLAAPALNQAGSTTHIRLTHTLLQLPLSDLLTNSKRPVQEIQRWLLHHLQLPTTKNYLPKVALDLITTHWNRMPTLSSLETELWEKSQIVQKEKQHRKNALISLQILLIIGVLMLGHWFENPYLLLYIILLLVLYPRYD